MDQLRVDRMNSDDPVFLEEHKQLSYLARMTLHHGHVDYREHVLPIILHLRPLVPMDNILHSIIVQVEPLLQIAQLLACRALRINPEHLTRTDLIRKPGHSLRRSPSTGLEKSKSDQIYGFSQRTSNKRKLARTQRRDFTGANLSNV